MDWKIEIDQLNDEDILQETIGEVIKCPFCNNLIEVDKLIEERMCPVCMEDLSEQSDDEFDNKE
ncbi:MAG: hypothetical protein U0L56_05910 [Lachnospiraceae bacterium]|nr:hypothetical protein [Lachnospiraceae bacterium]